ncbi:hypothetical protein H0W26_04230 [Candidatus Dependentiae bacterium]|nr:hypothetical protein [Candidatus Dependentiae bacterium]
MNIIYILSMSLIVTEARSIQASDQATLEYPHKEYEQPYNPSHSKDELDFQPIFNDRLIYLDRPRSDDEEGIELARKEEQRRLDMYLRRGTPKEIDSKLMHPISTTLSLPHEAEQNITNAGNQHPLDISSGSRTKEELKFPLPNDGGTITNTSEPDSIFLQPIPQRIYSFLWKDASCVQTVSEIILVGAFLGAIAYTYNESFRKRMQTFYRKLGKDTTNADHPQQISSSSEETFSSISNQDLSRNEEEQTRNSSSTNPTVSLENFPQLIESV